IGRPRASHPIRTAIAGRAARTSAKSNHNLNGKLVGQLHRLAEIAVVSSRLLGLRMNVIAGAGQRGDLQAARLDCLKQLLPFTRALQQFIDRTMLRSRITTCAKLDRLDTQSRQVIESLVQWSGPEDHRENANFHE